MRDGEVMEREEPWGVDGDAKMMIEKKYGDVVWWVLRVRQP